MTDTLERLTAALAYPSAKALAGRARMNAPAARLERRNSVSFRARREAPSRPFKAGIDER
ncbi:MAG: hypothetical protein IH877_09095 [Gemmatimonadetes bacterium]|nr:hypothetical protein [Gemmatimonadota bacterium]